MEYASGLMDGIGPRLTGSPNLKKANEWTRDQFTSMGCQNAHLEDWGEFGMGWRQLNTWVRMSTPDTAVFIAQALPWSPSSHGPINGAAVWVDAKDEKDLEKYKGKLAGKVVFFGPMRDVKPLDKALFKRDEDADLKKLAEYPVHIAEREDFFQEFIKRLAFRETAGKFFADEHAAAIDNGAGTVVAMEVMRILNSLKVQPRRTIRVALWTGEEEGEFGSYGYVKQHFGFVPLSTAPDQVKLPDFLRKPAGPLQLKPEQQKISGYFNVDNGSGKIRGIYLQENASIAPVFQQWIAPLSDLGVTTISMRNTGGTDHEAFDSVDIPGFQFIQDPLDYGSRTHHSNMDLYERLQPDDLAQAATVEAIFVYNAAMRDQMLPRKPLPHPELNEQRKAPLKNVMPGAAAAAEEMKKPGQ